MLDKKFNPQGFESKIFDLWIKNKLFARKESNKKNYFIIIPPPNVTGKLHLGHAWNVSIQDSLIRYMKLSGQNAYWIAGMDHAGIATQTKYESYIKDKNIDKNSFSRSEFIKNVYDWSQINANSIRDQWKKIGLALDYQNEYFTLDKNINDNVLNLFIKMYNDGLIYRTETLVNWDIKLKTAISNIEVIKKETITDLYFIKYQLKDSKDYLLVATTRPETMFTDTCLIVNPNDKRYKSFIGNQVINPANNNLIPIISDKYIDQEYGTGVMKCTPAHDFNDFKIWKKHKKPFFSCINLDGTMNEHANEFKGIDRLECRKKLVAKFQKNSVIEKIEKQMSAIGYSERTDEIVEPLLSMQWFVKMKPLAQKVIKIQKENKGTKFFPKRFEKDLFKWLENIEDWCISRQLKWGHQIPAWYNKENNEIYVGIKKPDKKGKWVRDEDVFDTWFSSGTLPFTATGFKFNNIDKTKVTSNVLVTAYDILFFWVSRMMMLTLYVTNKIPFKNVLIHGLIRDENNKKMSKSLGNGIDPMQIISEHGADALRLFLLSSSAAGEDLIYSNARLLESKFFLNKLWNISLFIQTKKKVNKIDSKKLVDFDKWIFNRMFITYSEFKKNFEKYNFIVAIKILIKFIKEDLSSTYLELNKSRTDDAYHFTLYNVLKQVLILLHPISPFVTEQIYQSIFKEKKSILDERINIKKISSQKLIDLSIEILEFIRNFKWENNLKKNDELEIYINFSKTLKIKSKTIEEILKYENVIIKQNNDSFENKISKNINGLEITINHKVDNKKINEKKESEIKFLMSEIDRTTKILANKNFILKAPPHLVKEEQEKLAKYQKMLSDIKSK